MSFGSTRGNVYDLLLFGLAALVVYPDRILDWISYWTGRKFGWRHLLLLEALAMATIVVAMTFLTPAYPWIDWWRPILFIGMLGVLRALIHFLTDFFGFRGW